MILLDIDWDFMNREWMGDDVASYCRFLGIVLGTLLLKRPAATILSRFSSTLTERFSKSKHKDMMHTAVRRPIERLLQTILFYIALNQVSGFLDKFSFHLMGQKGSHIVRIGDIANHVFLFLFIIFLTQVASHIMDFVYRLRQHKAEADDNKSNEQLLPLMKELSKLFLWTLSIFWIMGSVFQVNIPALITGLGIGGVAIALAGKETVENLFAAFTILSDKPFVTGDIIKLGDFEGTVERIGFRSTRMRNTDGAAYIIPNQKLVGENLVNLTQRDTRGVKVVVNIKYGVPHEAVEKMIGEIREMVRKTEPIKDSVEVTLENFGETTFQVIVNYHLPDPLAPGTSVIAIKQQINLGIYAVVAKYTTVAANPTP